VMQQSSGILAVCRALEKKAKSMAPQVPVIRLEDFSLLEHSTPVTEDLRQIHRISGCLFMYVGNLEHYQGLDLLLEAFALLDCERSKASLVIIGGSDKDIDFYRGRADQLGLGEQVFFLGPRPVAQLSQYLRQADVLVSPRIQGNNTPMKIYSYLDSGRPVLATRLDTHTQVLDEDIAILVEPTPEALMQGMAALQADPQLRERLAYAASQRVLQQYSREAFSRKLRQFYADVATSIPPFP
jgi:glycosyltransferase involved in cell wall biosynthesis